MRIGSKPTVYIIDGLNFIRSFFMEYGADENNATGDFMSWLEEAALTLEHSFFRVIFDGPYRPFSMRAGNVKITFSESLSADDLIAEQGIYLHKSGERTAVITSDRSLQAALREEGVKVSFCDPFFEAVNRKIRQNDGSF